MKAVSRYNLTTKEYTWGISGVDVDGCRQLYPDEEKATTLNRIRLLRMKEKPKDPRFRDRRYENTLKALDRI